MKKGRRLEKRYKIQKQQKTSTVGEQNDTKCKKFKFHHSNKWYTHKLEYVTEKETQRIIRDLSSPNSRLKIRPVINT